MYRCRVTSILEVKFDRGKLGDFGYCFGGSRDFFELVEGYSENIKRAMENTKNPYIVAHMRIWRAVGTRKRILKEIALQLKDTVWSSESCDVLFLSGDVNRADLVDGLATDKVLDPLREIFEGHGLKTSFVAVPGSRLTGNLTVGNVLSMNRTALWHKFFRSLTIGHILKKPRTPEQTGVFKRLLKTVRPRLVLALNASSGLCQAAFDAGVPVLEVLHARGYGVPYKPEWWSQERVNLPDGMVGYDDSSQRAFSNFLPYLRVPYYRLSYEMELAKNYLEGNPPPDQLNDSKVQKVVLFTCGYNPENRLWEGGLPPELVQLVRRRKDLFLLVRMHPVMRTEDDYEEARNSLLRSSLDAPNINVSWASEAPIYAVLQYTDLHITWESATAYEAADFGLATYFLEDWRDKHPKRNYDLIERGLIHFIVSSEEVFEVLVEKSSKRPPVSEPIADVDPERIVEFGEVNRRVSRLGFPASTSDRVRFRADSKSSGKKFFRYSMEED